MNWNEYLPYELEWIGESRRVIICASAVDKALREAGIKQIFVHEKIVRHYARNGNWKKPTSAKL